MSGLLKPLTHSTKTQNPSDNAINVEKIVSMDKITVLAGQAANQRDRFEISFTMDEGAAQHKVVEWKYDLVTDRDDDYASLLTNNSVVLT